VTSRRQPLVAQSSRGSQLRKMYGYQDFCFFPSRASLVSEAAVQALAWDYGHRDFVLPAKIHKIVSDVFRFQVLCICRGAFFPLFPFPLGGAVLQRIIHQGSHSAEGRRARRESRPHALEAMERVCRRQGITCGLDFDGRHCIVASGVSPSADAAGPLEETRIHQEICNI